MSCGYVYNLCPVFLHICFSTLNDVLSTSCHYAFFLCFRRKRYLSTTPTFGAKIISLYLLLVCFRGKVLYLLFISVLISTAVFLFRFQFGKSTTYKHCYQHVFPQLLFISFLCASFFWCCVCYLPAKCPCRGHRMPAVWALERTSGLSCAFKLFSVGLPFVCDVTD